MAYEGTSQVKESKITFLTHKYEVFKMEEGETSIAICKWFNNIIVGLKGLGKGIVKAELKASYFYLFPRNDVPR